MRRPALGIGCGVLVLLATEPCLAVSKLGLELDACAELSEHALREHLELELATLGLADTAAQLQLRCHETSVTIELRRDAAAPSYPIEVRVELRDTAKAARERLVALAASELIAQAERAQQPSPRPAPAVAAQPKPDGAPSNVDHPPRSRNERASVALLLAGTVARHGDPKATLWGGSLGVSWSLSQTWSLLLETHLERGQQSLDSADVRWTSFSGFLGGGASTSLGPLRLFAGLGARAGWLALAATAPAPDEGQSLTAPWAGVAAPLRAAFDLGGAVAPYLGAEAGYVLLPVRGTLDDGSALTQQRGPWLGASLGALVRL